MAQRSVERTPPGGPLEASTRAAPGTPPGRRASGPDRTVACDGDPVPPARHAPLPAPDTGALRERGPRPPLGAGPDQLSSVASEGGVSSPPSGAASGVIASGVAASAVGVSTA